MRIFHLNLKLIRNAVSVFTLLDERTPPKVVFTTQRDNRVDDLICLKLAGIAFQIDDPLRPIIPDDTHPNCRCYYVDEITGQIVSDISSKRDVKRRNRLTDRQRKNVVKEDRHYLTQKKMDKIVEYMEKNEQWQKKSKDFVPTDDTGIRPLAYNEKTKKRASLEQISKWIRSI
jgi:hypothetical protein